MNILRKIGAVVDAWEERQEEMVSIAREGVRQQRRMLRAMGVPSEVRPVEEHPNVRQMAVALAGQEQELSRWEEWTRRLLRERVPRETPVGAEPRQLRELLEVAVVDVVASRLHAIERLDQARAELEQLRQEVETLTVAGRRLLEERDERDRELYALCVVAGEADERRALAALMERVCVELAYDAGAAPKGVVAVEWLGTLLERRRQRVEELEQLLHKERTLRGQAKAQRDEGISDLKHLQERLSAWASWAERMGWRDPDDGLTRPHVAIEEGLRQNAQAELEQLRVEVVDLRRLLGEAPVPTGAGRPDEDPCPF